MTVKYKFRSRESLMGEVARLARHFENIAASELDQNLRSFYNGKCRMAMDLFDILNLSTVEGMEK